MANNQNNQNNQNKQNDNGLFAGICMTALGALCLIFWKEDVFSVLGLFDISGKTLGIVSLVLGGWNLLTNDDFGKLLGEILALPFRLLGWALEHWYLVVLAIALFSWLKPEEKAPAKEETSIKTQTQQTQWTEAAPTETEWVPPATTAPVVEYVQQPYAGMHREAGLCRNLREDAMILLVFVDDSGSTWTQQEIQNFLSNNVGPGLDFIEYRASEYGYSITVDNCVYPDENGNTRVMYYNGSVKDWSPGGELTQDLISRATEVYGFAATADMIKNVQDYAGTDQVGIVFCLDKEGRSYAWWHESSKDFVEYAVLFTRQNGAKTRAEVVAHEVMHLFGADDMYSEDADRANRAAMAKKLHPRELFYQGQWNLYDNVISSYTAYAVGWLDYLPAQYDCPEWWS